MIDGCWSRAVIRASRSNRRAASRFFGSSSLIATRRPSRRSRASSTRPIPPFAISPRDRVVMALDRDAAAGSRGRRSAGLPRMRRPANPIVARLRRVDRVAPDRPLHVTVPHCIPHAAPTHDGTAAANAASMIRWPWVMRRGAAVVVTGGRSAVAGPPSRLVDGFTADAVGPASAPSSRCRRRPIRASSASRSAPFTASECAAAAVFGQELFFEPALSAANEQSRARPATIRTTVVRRRRGA